jgi:hypothetical protein
MKLLFSLLLALCVPFAPDDPGEIDPVPVGRCCVPPAYVNPPPSLSCPSGTFCGTPSCSGTAGASLTGLNCIPAEAACDTQQDTQWYSNIPIFTCKVRYLGNQLCIQMYPKWTCVWSNSGTTGLGSYSGIMCGQSGDDFCE